MVTAFYSGGAGPAGRSGRTATPVRNHA